MNFLTAFILGIVEGLTEFLPISSTGHLILTSHVLGLPNSEFLKMFEIVIQTGAIAAVVFIYRKELYTDRSLWWKMAVAFVPTGALGLVAHSAVKKYLFSPSVVCASLFVGGFVLLLLERLTKDIKQKEFRTRDYVLLGTLQCLAFIPGVSRSAATILGALLLGAGRKEAVKFSFLLAIPTIFAASGYSLLKVKYQISSDEVVLLLVGLLTSFVFGYLSVKTFLKWLDHRTFIICGVYRIAVAVAFYFLFIR